MNLPNISPSLRRHDAEPGGGASPESPRGQAADFKDAAGGLLRDAGEQLKSAARQAKEQAAHLAEEQKDRAARHVGAYGSAMHSTAAQMENEDPNIAWVTHAVADRIQKAADYLRANDFSKLQSDLEGLARRNPIVFFGGLFVAGLVVGNLVTATARETPKPRSGASDADSLGWAPYGDAPRTARTDNPGGPASPPM
ncbi:hypothetical protein K0B96_04715 [Horticoccus luteus]|uniref:Uncharacterized protein n=1 Tax=Horticoccus luteus TaxID=2862869 RepID=A0A8F9TXZ6_9BACT|nr:hypothetical protein [Horticoccus luteus]QYM79924.1 hypothetical protein K0B96_04715 [Horticoccus luteus]